MIPVVALVLQFKKEFTVSFYIQAECYHYREFIQCLQMKVHSLLNSQNISRVYDSSQVSSQSESQENTDHLQLKPSEIGALMTGIGNMLINLKKKLCEIILAWNARYFCWLQLIIIEIHAKDLHYS